MGKKLGVTIIGDREHRMLHYYREKLREEESNNPVNLDAVEGIKKHIRRLERRIQVRHKKPETKICDISAIDQVILNGIYEKLRKKQQLNKKQLALLEKYAHLGLKP